MKENIIATVDFIAYCLFGIVAFVGGSAIMLGQAGTGAIILVAGWLICCILSGSWFVLSKIAENGSETNVLLKELLEATKESKVQQQKAARVVQTETNWFDIDK